MNNDDNIVRGRGASINPKNPFLSAEYGRFEIEGLDEGHGEKVRTEVLQEKPKKIINRVTSPDLGFDYSMNPYQGCEHGCAYCYARNSHHYWGYSAGLDFERKIIVKMNAAEKLEEQLRKPGWKVSPIMLSGNTDCYQPLERKLGLTRKLLEVLLRMRHPVSIITKNELITRDIDLLKEMAAMKLVSVSISMNSVDEKIRRKLEPRTTTYAARLKAMELLSEAGIPVNVMIAPVIPGLTVSDIPAVMKASAEAGAISAGYTILRLNGAVAEIFADWATRHFPGRAEKILRQVAECHGGKVNDSRFGKRMRGEGRIAISIRHLFTVSGKKYMPSAKGPELNCDIFKRPELDQLSLF